MRNRRADVQEGFCTNRFSFRYSRSSKKLACADSAGQCVADTIVQTTTIRAISSLAFEADCFEALFPRSMVFSAGQLVFCRSGLRGFLHIGIMLPPKVSLFKSCGFRFS